MGQLDVEVDWIRQSREGNHESFAALIARYQRMVHSLTFRMTGSLADSEDLAQETFILAFRRLDCFRGEPKFSSWPCQIAVNTCLSWRKRRARRERTHQEWTEQEQIFGGTWAAMSEAEEENTWRVQAAFLRLSWSSSEPAASLASLKVRAKALEAAL